LSVVETVALSVGLDIQNPKCKLLRMWCLSRNATCWVGTTCCNTL